MSSANACPGSTTISMVFVPKGEGDLQPFRYYGKSPYKCPEMYGYVLNCPDLAARSAGFRAKIGLLYVIFTILKSNNENKPIIIHCKWMGWLYDPAASRCRRNQSNKSVASASLSRTMGMTMAATTSRMPTAIKISPKLFINIVPYPSNISISGRALATGSGSLSPMSASS